MKWRVLEIARIARAKGPINHEKLKERYRRLLDATSRVVGQAKRFLEAQMALEGRAGPTHSHVPRMSTGAEMVLLCRLRDDGCLSGGRRSGRQLRFHEARFSGSGLAGEGWVRSQDIGVHDAKRKSKKTWGGLTRVWKMLYGTDYQHQLVRHCRPAVGGLSKISKNGTYKELPPCRSTPFLFLSPI